MKLVPEPAAVEDDGWPALTEMIAWRALLLVGAATAAATWALPPDNSQNGSQSHRPTGEAGHQDRSHADAPEWPGGRAALSSSSSSSSSSSNLGVVLQELRAQRWLQTLQVRGPH